MKLNMKPIRKRGIPVTKADFADGLILCGKMPEKIKALIVDVDGTLFPMNDPFFKARRKVQNRWLGQRLGLSETDLQKRIAEQREALKTPEGKRVGFSEIVYGLDSSITCAEWQEAMNESIPRENFSCRLKQNPDLEEAISDVTADHVSGVRMVFATNATAETAQVVLKMLFGARIFNHGMFAVVGHDKKISKPDPAFFSELVAPQLRMKNVSLRQTVSIGDRLGDDGVAAIEAGVAAAVIVNGPGELAQVLRGLHELRNRAY
jgi:FMN phosphatase YigB (HAD superfamily)